MSGKPEVSTGRIYLLLVLTTVFWGSALCIQSGCRLGLAHGGGLFPVRSGSALYAPDFEVGEERNAQHSQAV